MLFDYKIKRFILFCWAFLSLAKAGSAQPGKIDSSFGNNGIVKTDFGFINDKDYPTAGRQVLLSDDKKLYILIESLNQSYIAKRTENGSADVSYGNNGFSGSSSISQAVAAMQPDGKIVIAGNDLSNNFAVARFNTDGTPDNTFNGSGRQTTDFGSGVNIATAIAIQTDGKIVVAGYAYIENRTGFAIARYNADGTADSTFSENGKQMADFGSETNLANALAIQNDGKIVVAGQTYGANFSDFAIARFNSNGTPDSSFSEDGMQTTDFEASDDIARALSIQSDGKIVIAGLEYKCNEETCSVVQFALLRYNTNGTLDNTFAHDGKQVTSFAVGFYATSLAIQNDKKIVVAGYAENENNDFAIARFNTSGNADSTFGIDGKLTTDINGKDDRAYSAVIQSDGKIVAAGADEGNNFELARYNTDGSPDNTFSRGGELFEQLHLNQGSTYYTSSIIQADGKLVTAGYTLNGDTYDFALARYNADGTPDNSFSADGKQTTDFASSGDYAYSAAIQKDGKIVLAGAAGSDIAIARYNTDGSPDSSFGKNGKKIINFGLNSSAAANSVAIQQNGKIVVAGYVYSSGASNADFTLTRYNTDGSTDTSFSSGKEIMTDFGFDDIANAVAIQNDGKIIVAGYSLVSLRESSSFFVLARYNADGALDKSFSEDGKLFTIFDQFSVAKSVNIQKDGKIVAAGSASSSDINGEDFALARYNADGSPDSTFSEDGLQIRDAGSLLESANSAAVQEDGKIITGGSSGGNFAITRFNTNGSADSSFNNDGIIITEASGQNDVINNIVISNDKLYAIGYGEYPGNLGVIAKYSLAEINKNPNVRLSDLYNFVKYSVPANIKLNAKATDEDGTISKVEFYNGTTLLHTETIIPYGYLWKKVPVGNYTITAKAYDNSGNVTTSDAIKVSVVSENVPPVVSIVNPADNKTYGAHSSVRLIANAKDPNDAISKVEFYSNGTLLRTEKHYPYAYWWDNLQPGTYTITAVATDAKGLSATSAPVHITVEPNQAPAVSITTPANHQTFAGPADIKLEAAAKDADGTIHKVEFYNGKTLLHTETLAPYGYLWKNVPAGTYTITAKAFDNRGAPATSAPVTVTVTSQGATIVSSRPSAKESKTGENSAISLKLYPNPAKNILSINTTGLQQSKPSAISVISASGVVVKTMQSNVSNRVVQLDVSSLTSGVYTVKIMSGYKIMYKQFVKL